MRIRFSHDFQNLSFSHIRSGGDLLNSVSKSLFYLKKLLPSIYEMSWSCFFAIVAFDLWKYKFKKILNTGPLGVSIWWKWLPGASQQSHSSKTPCLPVSGHLVTLAFDSPIFSNTKYTSPVSLSIGRKFLPGMYEWSYGSKTVIFSIFGHMMNLSFDL